jgi:hypothetical protein
MILYENITSPLKYHPIKFGDAEIKSEKGYDFDLLVKGEKWLAYDSRPIDFKSMYCSAATEVFLEINLGYGTVITTGLGLGIKETLLANKPEVDQVIVYEKNLDVIEIFKIFCQESNYDSRKIKIINQDADLMSGLSADCIFIDHFENESLDVIENRARKISNSNTCSLFWYWTAWNSYFVDIMKLKQPVSQESFIKWCLSKKIDSLISEIPNDIFQEAHKLYLAFTSHPMGKHQELDLQREKIRKFFKRNT